MTCKQCCGSESEYKLDPYSGFFLDPNSEFKNFLKTFFSSTICKFLLFKIDNVRNHGSGSKFNVF